MACAHHARFQKFFQSGSNSDVFSFSLVDEWRDDPNTTKREPSLIWRFAGGQTMAQH